MVVAVAVILLVAVTAGLAAELWARARRDRSGTAAPPAYGTALHARSLTDASGIVVALRSRRWATGALSGVSVVLLVVAVGLFGYPFATNMYQDRVQGRLEEELAGPAAKQRYRMRAVRTGDSLTRLRIPAIGVDVVIVEGTTPSALRAGAGHYPATPLPCENGNVGIAGHRTTYGQPFHDLDRLVPGDEIILDTPVGSCTYHVAADPFVVPPTDVSVVGPTSTPALTLTTCHPKGSARQRLIVRAHLVGPTPRAAA